MLQLCCSSVAALLALLALLATLRCAGFSAYVLLLRSVGGGVIEGGATEGRRMCDARVPCCSSVAARLQPVARSACACVCARSSCY